MIQTVSYKKALASGIIRHHEPARDVEEFITYANARPTQYGALQYEYLTAAFTTAHLEAPTPDVTIDHPFPQLFRGRSITLLVDATRVFQVNEADWTITQLTTYDIYSTGSTKAIDTGGVWHFVDYGSAWFLFNGVCVVFKTGWVDSSKVFVETATTITTGCDFNGHFLMGGFSSSDYFNAGWLALWAEWAAKGIGYGLSVLAPGGNCVTWSDYGSAGLEKLFLPALAQTGPLSGIHGSENPFDLENARRMTAGAAAMDWGGTVQCLKPLRNSVMVYGTNGVSALVASREYCTFGLADGLHHAGIATRGAVGGDRDKHLFLDETGQLCLVTEQGGRPVVEPLGYEDSLAAYADDGQFTISYDQIEQRFFISAPSVGFMLSRDGALSKIPEIPTSMVVAEGGLVAVSESTGTGADVELVSVPTTFRIPGIKTVRKVRLVGDWDTYLPYVRLYYRMKAADSFTLVGPTQVDAQGEVELMVPCFEAYFKVEWEMYQGAPLALVDISIYDLFVDVQYADGSEEDVKMSIRRLVG